MMGTSASIRAIGFSTTIAAVRRLGGPSLPWGYRVSVVGDRFEFTGMRKPEVVWSLPASSVVSLAVRETTSRGWAHRDTKLAVVFTVTTTGGPVELPVVPISDDGRRSLTWKESEVRALARRLEMAIRGRYAE